MNAQEITRRLLNGSYAIDRMRTEVVDTVSMLVGLVQHYQFNLGDKVSHTFESDFCEWVVGRLEAKDKLMVDCWTKGKGPEDCVFSHTSPSESFRTTNVQFVHSNLHVLVEGLLKAFPQLEAKCRPFIDASFVDFGNHSS